MPRLNLDPHKPMPRDERGWRRRRTGAGCPIPTVILDRDCIVQWVDVHPDYSTRSEPEQILAAVDALARA